MANSEITLTLRFHPVTSDTKKIPVTITVINGVVLKA